MKQTGLFVFCNGCKGQPKNGKCALGGKCPTPEKHVYKVKFYIPGTKKYRSAVLDTRDEQTASEMALIMRHNFKNGREAHTGRDFSIFNAILKFIDYKKNPTKNRKPASDSTITDYSLHLGRLTEALQEARLDTKALSPTDIGNHTAEIVFKFLSKKLGSQVTIEKHFATYEHFCNYLIKDEGFQIINPFTGWHFTKKIRNNDTITAEQFRDLLEAIEQRGRRNIKGENMYYPWLSHAIRLGLYSGARRQEIPVIKWSDILPNSEGGLEGGFLLLSDMKVSAIRKMDSVKAKPIEINDDLADLLYEMGYENMKEQNKYIIDPSEEFGRSYIKEILSRSFTHYASFVCPDLTFACLRKTWFTSCAIAIGIKNASKMGGHSSEKVTLAHYIDELKLAGTLGKFKRVFEKNRSPKSLSEKS